MTRLATLVGRATAALLLFFVLTGHEYWLEPQRFCLTEPGTVAVGIRVGEHFVGETRMWDPDKIERLTHRDARGEHRIALDTAYRSRAEWPLSLSTRGGQLVSMQTTNRLITLEPAKFDDYLRSDGMEYVIDERNRLGESQRPGREAYRRCAKLLLQVGEASAADQTYAQATGMTLELIPVRNPYQCRPGDTLSVRVTFEGKALAGALVAVRSRHPEPNALRAVRTDARGLATLTLPPAGPCLISLVHMVRVSGEPSHDWQSYWGSYCFEVPN